MVTDLVANMESDMIADMVAKLMADMEVNMVADIKVNMVADIKVDKIADMKVTLWLIWRSPTWCPIRVEQRRNQKSDSEAEISVSGSNFRFL